MNCHRLSTTAGQRLAALLGRMNHAEDFELDELETFVADQIEFISGRRRGSVTGAPGLDVQRVSLTSPDATEAMKSVINWQSGRIRECGCGRFKISLRRQAASLVVIAEWERAPQKPEPAVTSPRHHPVPHAPDGSATEVVTLFAAS